MAVYRLVSHDSFSYNCPINKCPDGRRFGLSPRIGTNPIGTRALSRPVSLPTS